MVVGWCDGAIVLGKLPIPGHSTNLDYSRASGWGCLDIFLSSGIYSFFHSGRRPDID